MAPLSKIGFCSKTGGIFGQNLDALHAISLFFGLLLALSGRSTPTFLQVHGDFRNGPFIGPFRGGGRFVLCSFRFNVVPAVAFDGVLAYVDEFTDDEEGEERCEVSAKSCSAQQAADGG